MVSMVGLSYAFPNGIDRNKLKYKGRFAEIIDALPKFPAQIQRLEKICSTIYAITFLMFMLMVGAFLGIVVLSVLVISWMVIHPGSFNAAMEHIDLYFNIVILVLAVPYIIDFVTLGGLKRVKWLHVIYRLLSTVTLSPIYRPVYYGIVSNFKKRYVISGLVVYMAISIWMYFVVGNKSFSAHDMYPPFSKVSEYTGYFEDHTEGPISRFAHVPPDVVDGNVLPLFAVHNSGMEDSIAAVCNTAELAPKKFPFKSGSENMPCLNYFYIPVIDSATIREPNRGFRKHERYHQLGLRT